MGRISIYVRNKKYNPSSYYRIIQYTVNLKMESSIHSLTPDWLYNISLNGKYFSRAVAKIMLYIIMTIRAAFFITTDLITHPDTIFIQREILPRKIPFFIYMLEKKLVSKFETVWDIDDDIIGEGEISKKETQLLITKSKAICVNNVYLKECFAENIWGKIYIVPTTDGDINKNISRELFEEKIKKLEEEIQLMWLGTTCNLKFIEQIIPVLEEYAKGDKRTIVLNIISGQNINISTKKIIINNIKWSRENAAKILGVSHIGVMPLSDNEYTRRKGGFKLIQYISGGLPIIGSGVGVNSDIISHEIGGVVYKPEDWCYWIQKITENKNVYRNYAQKARKKWEDEYSYSHILALLNAVFEGRDI